MESNTFKPPLKSSEYGLGEVLLGGAVEGFNDELLASSCDLMDVIELNGLYNPSTNYMTGQIPPSPAAFADSTFPSLEWTPGIQGQSRFHNHLHGPDQSGHISNDAKSCVAHLGFCDCSYCLSDEFLSQENEQHPDQPEILCQPDSRVEEVEETHERPVPAECNYVPIDAMRGAPVGEVDSMMRLKMASKQWKPEPKSALPHAFNYDATCTGLGQYRSFGRNSSLYQRHNAPAETKSNLYIGKSELGESNQEEGSSNSTASSHSSPGLSPSRSSSHLLVEGSADILMRRPSLDTDENHSLGRGRISTKAKHQPKTPRRFVFKSPSRPHKSSPKPSAASTLRWFSPATSLSDGIKRLEVNREMLPYPTEIQKKALAIVTGLSYSLVKDFYEAKHSNPLDSAYCSNSSGEDSISGIHEHVQDTSSIEEHLRLSPKDQTKAPQEDIVSETLVAETSKRFQCTWYWKGCSKSFDKKGDWIRHEETVHCLQELWTCNLPGHSGMTECGREYKVDYKCREHLRKDHKCDEKSAVQMAESFRQAVSPPRPFRDECGFCGGRFTDWNERIAHIAEHAEKGKRMSEWQDPFPRGKGAGPDGPDDDDDNNGGGHGGSGSGPSNSSNGKSNHGGNGGHWIQPKPGRDGDSDQRGNKRKYNGGDWNQRPHEPSSAEHISESDHRVDLSGALEKGFLSVLKLVQTTHQELLRLAEDIKKKCMLNFLDESVHEEAQGWKQSRSSRVFPDSSEEIEQFWPPTVFPRSSKVVTQSKLDYVTVFYLIINMMIGSGLFANSPTIFRGTKHVGFCLIFCLLGTISSIANTLTLSHYAASESRTYSRHSRLYRGERSYLSYLDKHSTLFAGFAFGTAYYLTENAATNVLSFVVHTVRAAGHTDFDVDPYLQNISYYFGVTAVGTITAILLMHGMSRRTGIAVNNMLAIFKILMLLTITILGFIIYSSKASNASLLVSKNLIPDISFNMLQTELYGYALACLGVALIFARSKRVHVVAGEFREAKEVSRSPVLFAVGTTCILYTLVNIAFIFAVPVYQQVTSNLAEFMTPDRNSEYGISYIYEYGITYTTEIINALLAVSALSNLVVTAYVAARVKQIMARERFRASLRGRNYVARCTTTLMGVATGMLSGVELIVMPIFSVTSIPSTLFFWVLGKIHQEGAAESSLQPEDYEGKSAVKNGGNLRCRKPGKPSPSTTEPNFQTLVDSEGDDDAEILQRLFL